MRNLHHRILELLTVHGDASLQQCHHVVIVGEHLVHVVVELHRTVKEAREDLHHRFAASDGLGIACLMPDHIGTEQIAQCLGIARHEVFDRASVSGRVRMFRHW